MKGYCLRPTTSANAASWPRLDEQRSPSRPPDRIRCGSSTFSEYETIKGGTWRVAGIADYWSKYEFGWHWSATANQFDAITAVELAITEAEKLLGHRLADLCRVDERTGELLPATTLVTDNGGPFKSFRFGAFITAQPALQHVRTKAKPRSTDRSRDRVLIC